MGIEEVTVGTKEILWVLRGKSVGTEGILWALRRYCGN